MFGLFQVEEELEVIRKEVYEEHKGRAGGGQELKVPLADLGKAVSNLFEFTKKHK